MTKPKKKYKNAYLRRTVPIFDQPVFVCVGPDYEEWKADCAENFDLTVKDNGVTIRAAMMKIPDSPAVALYFSDDIAHSTITHEAIHAVYHMLSKSGVGPMNEDTEEVYAYLTGWLVGELYSLKEIKKRLVMR